MAGKFATHPHLGVDPIPVQVPIGPVRAVAAHSLALAPAVLRWTANAINAAYHNPRACVAGNHNLQAGAQQHLITTNLGLAEVNAAGLGPAIAELDHKAGLIGFLAVCLVGS
jgi:hypothetical protein